MDLRRHIRVLPAQRTGFVPFINLILVIIVFAVLASALTGAVSLPVQLPKGVTSDMAKGGAVTVVVTSENILYVNGKVTTLKELRELLSAVKAKDGSVLIKADRRASLGRVADIWDLGRGLGITRISVAADQGE